MVLIGGVAYKTSSNKLTKAKTPPSTDRRESQRSMANLPNKKIGELVSFFLIFFRCVVLNMKNK